MKRQVPLRLAARPIVSCLVGILVAAFIAPYLVPLVDIENIVLAGILGAILFLTIATIGSLMLRRSIRAAPVRSGLAAPVIVAVTIYLGLRLLSGFDPAEAHLAADAGLVGGFCALLGSAIFLIWTHMTPADPAWPR